MRKVKNWIFNKIYDKVMHIFCLLLVKFYQEIRDYSEKEYCRRANLNEVNIVLAVIYLILNVGNNRKRSLSKLLKDKEVDLRDIILQEVKKDANT